MNPKNKKTGVFLFIIFLFVFITIFITNASNNNADNLNNYSTLSFKEIDPLPEYKEIDVNSELNEDLNNFSKLSIEIVDTIWQDFSISDKYHNIDDVLNLTAEGDVPSKLVEDWFNIANKIPRSIENHFIVEIPGNKINSLNEGDSNVVKIYANSGLVVFDASIIEISPDGKEIKRDIKINSAAVENTMKVAVVLYSDNKTVFNKTKELSYFDKTFLIILLYISIGIIAEVLILIVGKIDLKKLWLSFKYSFIAMLFIALIALKDSYGVDLEYVISYIFFIFLLIFSLIFGALFKKEILPKISGTTVILYSLIFWFLLSIFLYPSIYFFVVAIPFSLITLYILYILFYIKSPSYLQLISLLSWFFIIIISLGYFQISFMSKINLEQNESYFHYIFLGMMYVYIAINFWYLFLFSMNSNAHKGDVEEKKIKQLEKDFIDHKIRIVPTIIIVIFQMLILVINHYFEFISDYSMIGFFIIFFIPFISKYLQSDNNYIPISLSERTGHGERGIVTTEPTKRQ